MAKKKRDTYSDLHSSLMGLSEPELEVMIDRELNRTDRPPRHDLLGRLCGRFNRLRANRTTRGILAMMDQAGRKDASAVLYRRVAVEKRPNNG